MNFRINAILALRPNAQWSMADDNVLRWHDKKQSEPSEEQIQEKVAELEATEPLRQLREQRNQLLQQSDWMALSDRTMTQAQIDYRQALRDLPATADPQLDENGNLTNVNWPEEP